MDFKMFGVLLWKHWCVRKRRIIFTLLEYLLPLVMFILLFVSKSSLVSTAAPDSSLVSIQRPDAYKLDKIAPPKHIFYTPDTIFTQQLMKAVGKKLENPLNDHSSKNEVNYYPIDKITEIAKHITSENITEDFAVVIFQDVASMPENLRYTIRMKEDFMTQLDTSMDGELTAHKNFGTIYEPFMRLQWAIDMSYLEMRTGKPITMDVTLQEFPFARRSNSNAIELLVFLINFCIFFSLILTFTLLVTRLISERANGVQELMKMSGVPTSLLALGHFMDTLPGVLMFSVMGSVLLTVGSPALLEGTNGFLLFLVLFLHSCSMVSFAFICGYLIRSLEYTTTLSVTIFFALMAVANLVETYVPSMVQPVCGVLPYLPLKWVMGQITMLGKYGVGLTFKSMMTAYDARYPAAGPALLVMILQTALFVLLAWYLDHVCPGKLGLAMPWDFFIKKQYWCKNNVQPDAVDEQESIAHAPREERYFEPAPAHADVGIKVVNITKVFPKHRALDNVSLDVYKGELTVLLGHNGAGKTTLMSIMTGTLNPTAGEVYVNGYDMMKTSDARKQIGFCPQHNMFYPQLSVVEHVVLFSMLRGQTRAEAWKSSHLLLERLGIASKADVLSQSLSGGMKRRLQMACALAGDASVVVLDEPSSGLDVETRRSLWDLVLGLRGSRTVLISTHFMEEADALGDRVAALHQGVLRCHATPMYLKKAIGTGYRLTFTTVGEPNERAITDVVTKSVPDAAVKEVSMNSISFALPAASSGAFPGMFAALEGARPQLGVDTIGVGVSTLEEVFLQLCSDIDTSNLTPDEVDGVSRVEPTYTHTTGLRLYSLQFWELLKRQMFYIWHKKYSFAVWQVLIPILIVVVMGTQLQNEKTIDNTNATARALDVGSYSPERQLVVLYRAGANDPAVRAAGRAHPRVRLEPAADVADVVLRSGMDDAMEYHKYLAGLEINNTDAKVLYTTTVRHAAPAALNLLANVLANALANGSTPAGAPKLTVVNDPIATDKPMSTPIVYRRPKEELLVYVFSFFVGSVLMFNLVNAVYLPIVERISGARHLLVMSGCAPELLWAVSLLARTLVATLTFILPVIIVCACDRDDTLNDSAFLAAWFMVMLLGTMAFLAFVFLISIHFNQVGSNTLLSLIVFCNIIFYFIGKINAAWAFVASVSLHAFPAHAALRGLVDAALRARANAFCSLNRHACDVTTDHQCMFCYGEENNRAPGFAMVILIAQFIVYMSMVCASQRGVLGKLSEKLKAARYTPPEKRYKDEMVNGERAYVSRAIGVHPPQPQDVMLVSDVHKVHNLLCKRFTAIRGISFSVKKGECLGLLGVNGAGKSTAFRVLTAEDWPTRGQVYAAGRYREGYSTKYMRGLGYCPQFFGLDAFLTGRQNLRLLLTLKGLNERDANEETKAWIRIVGLEKYIDRKVGGYSGGCQRRLAAAAALAMGAPLTLLDEPTSGVDVSARRRVWAALRRGLAHQRAVIITSHSMDEMEALCNRIAIMSGGELCALGSPAALRAAHAQGHAVVIKVAPPTPRAREPGKRVTIDETDAAAYTLNRLKGTLHDTFDCTLKDEHKTMLHYHINQTMQYSQIFAEMERLKSSFPGYVEDYSVTETTLEEVFLSFARPVEQDEAAETSSKPKKGRKDPERAKAV